MPASTYVLVSGMLLTGAANSLLSKKQDMVVVGRTPDGKPINFEQPVFQSLNMFAGEMLCLLPLLYVYLFRPAPSSPFAPAPPSRATRFLRRVSGKRDPEDRGSNGYARIAEGEGDDDDDSVQGGSVKGVDLDGLKPLTGWKVFYLAGPAACDCVGTSLMNLGLIYTPVSVYQMTRGSLVLWVGFLSVVALRRHLFLYQWLSLIGIMVGVGLVGLSGSLKPSAADVKAMVVTAMGAEAEAAEQVILGMGLIMLAQLFTATQFVVEESVMSVYAVEPLLAVGLEGVFGLLITAAAMPVLHILFSETVEFCNVYRLWHQVVENPMVIYLSLAIMLSISSFNYFGLSVTRTLSATSRSTIDTCRTIVIWAVSLLLGWEQLYFPASLVQLLGFSLLVYLTLVFNGLLQPPLAALRPGVIELVGEDGLEDDLARSGALPSEGAYGRVGAEVLPRLEEGQRGTARG